MKKTLLFLFSLLTIFSQSNNIKFTHLTTDDGLSQSNVKSIIQDNLGFLWFGTFDGLNKYDGYDFIVYKYDQNDSTSLISNSVSCIYEDQNGLLWIGTDQGACFFDRDKNEFFSFKDVRNVPKGVLEGEVGGIYGNNDFIYFATTMGLVAYDLKNKSFSEIIPKECKTVFIDSQNNIWIGTLTDGLLLLSSDHKNYESFAISVDDAPTKNYEVRAITEDTDGIIWIGTYGKGLTKINPNNFSNRSLTIYSNNPSDKYSISSNLILSLYADADGLWIGTDNGGLNYLSKTNTSFVKYQNNPNVSSSLNNNSIYSILKDNAGDLWFGTFSGGINYLNQTSQELRCYRKVPGNNNSLASNAVRDFAEDQDGNIWIATDGGGLDLFNIANNSFTHHNTSNTNLDKDAVLTVFIDSKQNIWIGKWDGGISKFDRRSNSFKTYIKSNSGIASNNIFDIDEDNQGRLWLSSTDGLIMYDPEGNIFKHYTTNNASLPINHTEVLKVDSEGNVLVGTTQGLSVFNPNTEKAIYTYLPDQGDNPLSTGFVTSIYEENNKTLWVGTINGLNRIDRTTKKVERFFEQDGLPNNSIRGIVKDDNGNLWISTTKGISKFNTEEKSFKNYTKLDGIQGNEYVINSFYKTRAGKILFGGVNGFDFFNPLNVVDNSFIPPVVVTDFLIFNKLVHPGTEDSPLTVEISKTNEIILSNEQSTFSFQYTALNYRASEKNQYKYMLEGFDENWNFVGTKRTASYTNIDPGEYIFRVKGSNNDGIWNDEGTSIRMVINPPFWATWWFRTIIILSIAAGVYYLIKRAKEKRKSLEEINSKLESEIRQHKEMEEENKRLAEEARVKDEEVKAVLNEQKDYLDKSVDHLLNEMKKFADGDLTVEMEIEKDDTIGQLFEGFNKAVKYTHNVISNVIKSIEQTVEASDTITSSSKDMSQGAYEQSNRANEVAAAVQQMSSSILASSKNSDMATKYSNEAIQVAIKGGEIVEETIAGMNQIAIVVTKAIETVQKLSESSNEIGEIVQLIQDIADQTNLLALNAAIEAARAGEQGRGFAVVAEEVKKLSEKTTDATKNITENINRIQKDSKDAVTSIETGISVVTDGKSLAKNAGDSLKEIIEHTKKVNSVIEQVAASNEEQSTNAEQISESITLINDVSQKTAVSSEAVNKEAVNLMELTLELKNQVTHFKLEKKYDAELVE